MLDGHDFVKRVPRPAPRLDLRSTRVLLAALGLLLSTPVLAAQTGAASDSAAAHYRRGLDLLAADSIAASEGSGGGFRVIQQIGRMLRLDRVSKARAEFEKALGFDPAHPGAAIQLARLILRARDEESLPAASEALARAAARERANAELWLLRAETAERLRDPAALTYVQRYEVLGGDPALARLIEARSLFALGRDSAGAAAYMRGLDVLSAAASDAYLHDLGPLVLPEQLAAWLEADAAGRADSIRGFWVRRSVRFGAPPAERIAEHYRRLRLAASRYRCSGCENAVSIEAVLHDRRGLGLDDRGVIYVLHGRPDQVLRTTHGQCRPNESWYYETPAGKRSLHFYLPELRPDYLLTTRIDAICFARGRKEWLWDREDDPGIARQLMRVQLGTVDWLEAAADLTRQAQTALREDTYYRDLGEPIEFGFDTYAFRAEDSRTRLRIPIVIASAEPRPSRDADSAAAFAIEATLVDTTSGEAFRVRHAPVPALTRAAETRPTLGIILDLAAPPGAYTGRVTVVRAGEPPAGSALMRRLDVRDLSGSALTLSDIMPGLSRAADACTAGAAGELFPARTLPAHRPASLYFEIYNLAPGEAYRTAIRVERRRGGGIGGLVRRLFGSGGAALTLEFDDVARPDPSGRTPVCRRLDFGALDGGAYVLSVEVRQGDASEAGAVEIEVVRD